MDNKLTHLDKEGRAGMVHVGHKEPTRRYARAGSTVHLPAAVLEMLKDGEVHMPKGPVLQTAQLAGVMAAKRTADLIPLCHPLSLSGVDFDFVWEGNLLHITCAVHCEGKTGVEMEALTGVSVAALTVYDMCKALSHEMIIENTRLLEKTGGKSDYRKEAS